MPRPNQFDAIQVLRSKRQQVDQDLSKATLAVEDAKLERDRLIAQGANRNDIQIVLHDHKRMPCISQSKQHFQ